MYYIKHKTLFDHISEHGKQVENMTIGEYFGELRDV